MSRLRPLPTASSEGGPAAWVAAWRAGDPDAFARLHAHYARMVHAILLARVPAQEAEDLVQDVFVRALRSLGTLRDAGAVGPWLCRIARNRAADFHRRRSRRRAEALPDDLPGESRPTVEAREALRAVRLLPDAYRETLLMRLVEGMTGPEIAERTGLTPASVRVNLHRGMRLLRERLQAVERS